MNNETTGKTVREQYLDLWIKLLLLPSQKIQKWLNGEKEQVKTPFMVKVFFLLVIGLSLASVANIGARAYYHNSNWFSYIMGACFALVVPATVFVAAHFKGMGRYGRAYAWGVAIFAATLSSFIQVKLYMSETEITLATWLTGNIDIEALSFSAGIPFFEVLIASLASMISDAHNKTVMEDNSKKQHEQEEQHKQELLEKQKQEEEDRKRKLQEQQDLLKLEEAKANVEIQRQERLARIEAEKAASIEKSKAEADAIRLKAEAKVESAKAKAVKSESIADSKVIHESDETILIRFYETNPRASQRDASRGTGLSQSKISRILNQLESNEVIHRNGNGVEIIGEL